MNHKIFAFVLPFLMMTLTLIAQETKPAKKVIIIKKINENGRITETRTEAEGKDADELIARTNPTDIEMMNVETGPDGKSTISITTKKMTEKKVIGEDKKASGEEVTIFSENFDGVKKEQYKIIKREGGKEKIIEWDGTLPMPAELEKELGTLNINKNADGKIMEITIDKKEGDNDVVIMHGEPLLKQNGTRKSGDEHPQYMRNRIHERPANLLEDKPNTNKVSLGVMIEDTDQGVIITDIIDGSPAAQAGLRRGDTMLKINDKYIFSANGLLDALRPFNPEDKVKIRYIRDGKENSSKTTLKARK